MVTSLFLSFMKPMSWDKIVPTENFATISLKFIPVEGLRLWETHRIEVE